MILADSFCYRNLLSWKLKSFVCHLVYRSACTTVYCLFFFSTASFCIFKHMIVRCVHNFSSTMCVYAVLFCINKLTCLHGFFFSLVRVRPATDAEHVKKRRMQKKRIPEREKRTNKIKTQHLSNVLINETQSKPISQRSGCRIHQSLQQKWE